MWRLLESWELLSSCRVQSAWPGTLSPRRGVSWRFRSDDPMMMMTALTNGKSTSKLLKLSFTSFNSPVIMPVIVKYSESLRRYLRCFANSELNSRGRGCCLPKEDRSSQVFIAWDSKERRAEVLDLSLETFAYRIFISNLTFPLTTKTPTFVTGLPVLRQMLSLFQLLHLFRML